MQKYLEQYPHQKDVFSRINASQSTKMFLEALKMHLAFDKQEEWESDPAGTIFWQL